MARNFIASLLLLVAAGFVIFSLASLDFNDVTLSQQLAHDYPGFLEKAPAETLDRWIQYFNQSSLQPESLESLWKLLWIKKEFYRESYLEQGQRQLLVEKVAAFKPGSLWEAYLQFNTLKYKLGVNSISALDTMQENVESGLCARLGEFATEADWQDSCDVSKVIEARFFCETSITEEEMEKAVQAIEGEKGNCVQHCREHCFEHVPVYVNGCENAANENEEYHCLFFH